MGRKSKDRATEREQDSSRSMEANDRNESLESVSGMESDRAERVMSAGSHGDASAGDEGVDDPAMSRAHRDDMSTSGKQGDKLRPNSSESTQREESQRSNRTEKRANDEHFDHADGFTGQGGQKEGSSESAEGTGYTGEEER